MRVMSEPGSSSDHDPKGYWRANLRLVAILMVIWAFVSFGLSIFFVEPLNAVHMGGFPLGFWFSHQGSIYTFIVLIYVYARLSDRIAERFGVD
jgi:putative solute:sodium symporter small subunit